MIQIHYVNSANEGGFGSGRPFDTHNMCPEEILLENNLGRGNSRWMQVRICISNSNYCNDKIISSFDLCENSSRVDLPKVDCVLLHWVEGNRK